jgi:secreted Zn-dependent insulinase-like peptidase
LSGEDGMRLVPFLHVPAIWATFFHGKTGIRHVKCIVYVLIALLAGTTAVQANQRYVPQSLYAYDRVKFKNGFQAILNPRKGATYVSMRLVVGAGSGDFDCADRELPHLVEHLMFSGTSRYTETELEELVTSLGGYWNASTMWDQTVY